MKCAFCNKPIERERAAWREQRGWSEPRTGGGVHALALRYDTGRLAHPDCVLKAKAGVSPEQESLM